MKTNINQIVTIVSFFTLALSSTLMLSWGLSSLTFQNHKDTMSHKTKVQIMQSTKHLKPDLNKTLKLLIPQSKR